MRLIRLLVALSILLTTLALRAEPSPPAEAQHWKGVIELPTGMKLDFTVALGPEGGTVSIPLQGAKDLPLKESTTEGASLRFTLAPPGAPEAAWAKFDLTIADDGNTASGQLHQVGQQFPVSMTRITAEDVASAGPKRPQTPKPPFPYEERDARFATADGTITIAGTLTVPNGAGPHPALILLTGSGPQDRNESLLGHQPFLVLADHLSRHGFAVLRCDDRGVGGSTGSVALATSDDFASDTLAAIDFLKAQPGIDPARLGLIGHSEGGIVAPIVASRSRDVRFIVLLAGTGLPGKDILRLQSDALLRAAGAKDEEALAAADSAHAAAMNAVLNSAPREEVKAKIAELAALQSKAAGNPVPDDATMAQLIEQQYAWLTSPWMLSFLALDPREALRKVSVPVLAIIGERDLQVPAKDNLPEIEAALKAAGNADATVRMLPGLNHLFQAAQTGAIDEYAQIEETINPAALDLVTAWLRERAGLQ